MDRTAVIGRSLVAIHQAAAVVVTIIMAITMDAGMAIITPAMTAMYSPALADGLPFISVAAVVAGSSSIVVVADAHGPLPEAAPGPMSIPARQPTSM
ncbi:MAG: hypothetical protein DHS20C06_08400 [Hyphobacterium sp.]|nr:MAG: hypothetical protein DHS20C06_08400 [Hyphobacterium sp.]